MRVPKVISLALLAGLVAGAALADKYGAPEKPWNYGPMQFRAIVPEQEPNNTCWSGQPITCGDEVTPAAYYPETDDDWFAFYAQAGSMMTIATYSYDGSHTDTYLELYDSDCATLLAYDDDSGPDFFSYIGFVAPHSGTYYIKSFPYEHLFPGLYQLLTSCLCCGPPGLCNTCNPDCYIARCSSGTFNGDMTSNTNDYDPGPGGCSSGYPEAGVDVAYRMDLQAGDIVDMTYHTPNFDAAFYVITDCADPAGSCVVGADAASDTEVIHWVVASTGTYYLILDHYGTGQGEGPWTLTYNLQCPPPSGACCVGEICRIGTQAQCDQMGGTYYGDDYPCDPSPCPPVPVRNESWGRIKAAYR